MPGARTRVANLQHAVRGNLPDKYRDFAAGVNDQSRRLLTIRGLLSFKPLGPAIALDDVEPASEIVKRFSTGAMSFGSISREAHSTLAIAMNRIGGKSNTGEGGEERDRFTPLPNGDSMRSAIKQVASGRFGVTTEYLVNADELQIKIAQGAKPGEGGQLPGHKVDRHIAAVRHSTPGVGLISPPPHHDIYSIEDLAQLIFDLKNANEKARVSVKLVSEVGVGTVAAGVAKARADHVTISGYEGGTGASPLTSLTHAGSPWEIGLAETQQTLVLNRLRGRIAVQADGGLRTGRDVAVAAILGADEFGFATAPLIAAGCIMMRKCHLNTCPVGVATQDPVLRARFTGTPEHVINYFFFVAEELREIMASLGVRKLEEMIGRTELMDARHAVDHWKARGIDLSRLLHAPKVPEDVAIWNSERQDHGLAELFDRDLISAAKPSLDSRKPVVIERDVRNVHRSVGTMLSGEVARRYGHDGLSPDSIFVRLKGTAGQSFGAFLAHGVTLELTGDGNDYVGKGLSGGRVIVRQPVVDRDPAQNIIVGNTVLYGAIAGEAYFQGVAGERFAVRNSGAIAVVEGAGDHCCEYMTGGHGLRARPGRTQLRSGHVGRHCLRLRPRRRAEATVQSGQRGAGRHCTGRYVVGRRRSGAESGQRPRLRHGPPDALRRRAPPRPARTPPAGDRQQEGRRASRRLAEGAAALRQSRSNRIPARAGGPRGRRCRRRGVECMGKPTGFLEVDRSDRKYAPVAERVKHFNEFVEEPSAEAVAKQASRCMDCGIPFCHSGCPVNNLIPDWNDLVYQDDWQAAIERLHETNNFPEVTGRICPAPCEAACTLNIDDVPVTIKSIEGEIVDRAFREGWVKPQCAPRGTGKRIAIVGSGPAGLACAQQLARIGHAPTVFEKSDRIGGLLRYGIPDFKLAKTIIDRRMEQMEVEGVIFRTNMEVGVTVSVDRLLDDYHILVLAGGAEQPRDLPVPGRELDGVHFAMDFLTQQNKRNAGDGEDKAAPNGGISALGKHVVVIGGGDTGSDCVGTSFRQGALQSLSLRFSPSRRCTRTRR